MSGNWMFVIESTTVNYRNRNRHNKDSEEHRRAYKRMYDAMYKCKKKCTNPPTNPSFADTKRMAKTLLSLAECVHHAKFS